MVIISKYSHNIEYNLKTTLDASGLTKLQHELSGVSSKLKQLANQEIIKDSERDKALKTVRTIQDALTKSFNPKVGMLDISGFEKNLKGLPLAQIQKDFALIGSSGNIAFNSLIASLGKVDIGLKSTSNSLTKMKNTVFNTVRWGIVSSAFNQMTNAIYDSVQYMQDLDKSLTNIMMVTDYSRDNMRDFAKEANAAAKALGSTTVEMTNASLIFAQQGFNLDQSSQLAEISTKLANASGQTTAETSDQITAYMNAYNIENDIQAVKKATDSWAEVANVSAADVEELATASKKAASTANTVGVSMDQLNGQIAAIESVTREAPEQIGNGLKTLYARFSDLETGKTLEDGVSLGRVTEELENIGVEVLRGDGTVRNVGDIMEDLMDVWSALNQTQKSAVASTVAGTYQLSRFEALMNRSDLYDQYKNASEDASGTLDVMNEKYVDSLQGKINKVQTSLEKVFTAAFNTDDLYGFLDILSEIIDKLGVFTEALGGGFTVINGLGAAALKVFSKDIGESLANFASNMWGSQLKQDNKGAIRNVLDAIGLGDIDTGHIEQTVSVIENGLSRINYMTDNQLKQYNKVLDETANAERRIEELKVKQKASIDATSLAYSAVGVPDIIPEVDEQGFVNTSELEEQLRAKTELKPEAITAMDWSSVGNALGKARDQLDIVERAFVKFTNAEKGAIGPSDDLVNTMVILEQALAKVDRAADGIASGTFGEIKEASQQLHDSIIVNEPNAQSTKGIEKTIAKLKENLIDLSSTAKDIQNTGGQVLGAEDFNQMNEKMAAYNSTIENAAGLNRKFFQEIDTSIAIQQIVQTTSAIQQLGFAWQAFQGLGALLSNEDLSLGDKLFGIITSLSMIIGNLVSAYQTLKNASNVFNMLSKEKQVNQILETKNLREQTAALNENTAALNANNQAKNEQVLDTKIPSVDQKNNKPSDAIFEEEDPINEIADLIQETKEKKQHNRNVRSAQEQKGLSKRSNRKLSKKDNRLRFFRNLPIQEIDAEDIAKIKEYTDKHKLYEGRQTIRQSTTSFLKKNAVSTESAKALTSASSLTKETKEIASAGEKVKQVLTTTSKTGISAFSKLGDIITKPTKALGLLASGLGKVIGLFSKFAGPIAIFTGLGSLVAGVATHLDKIKAEKLEKVRANAADARTELEHLAEAVPNFHNLYDSYKKGEASNEDLRQAAKELNDTLGDQSMLAATVAGDWDTYSQALDRAAQAERDKRIVELDKENTELKTGVGITQSLSNKDSELNSFYSELDSNQNLKSLTKFANGSMGLTKVDDDTVLKEYPILINAINEELAKSVDLTEEERTSLEETKTTLSGILQDSDLQIKNQNNILKGQILAGQHATDENFKLQNEGSVADYKARVKEQLQNQHIGIQITDAVVDSFVEELAVNDEEIADLINSESMEQAAKPIRDAWLEKANTEDIKNKLNSLTDKEVVKLDLEFDYETILKNINEIIERLNNGEDLGKIIVDIQARMTQQASNDESTFNNNYMDRAQAEETIKGVGLEGNFDDYKASIIQANEQLQALSQTSENYQKEVNRQERESTKIGNTEGENSKAYKDARKELNRLRKESENYNKILDTMVAKALEAEEGAKALAENFEDNVAILQSAGEGSAEYTDTINAMAADLGHMLNTDFSDWTQAQRNAFIGSADNLELMRQALNGSEEALQALRGELAKGGLEARLDVDPTSKESILAEASDAIATANGLLPNIEAGANVNDATFYAQLDAMIASAAAAGAKMTDIMSMLEELGVTAEIEYDTKPVNGSMPVPIMPDAPKGPGALQNALSVSNAPYSGKAVVPKIKVGSLRKLPPSTRSYSGGTGGKKGGGGGGKGGGGKGGGGKGGGGEKAYTPKENKDPIKNKVDRYEKVNTALAAIGADYERIADEQDRLSGDKLFNNLQKQNDLIKKQIALHEEKLQIQKAELAEVQNQLQSGFGITFDSDGLMQNYAQVHQALIDEVNRLNSQYSSVTSEAEEKALDAKVEAAEKRLSNFEELYQRYDGLLSSDLKDTIKQIEDLKDALEDLRIQAIRMTFEIAGNIKEINEAVSVILTPKEVWFDENPLEKAKHLIGDIDKFFDDPTANDEYYDKQIKAKEEELSKTTDETRKKRLEQDIANLKESKEQQGKGTIDKAGSGYLDMLFGNADFSLKEIEEYKATGKSSVYGENGAALYEDALKNLTALASSIEELRDKVKELQKTIDEAVSDAIEKCDELNHKYELINEDLEHQRDLVELVYGEKSFKEQRALIDAQIANNKAQIASQKRIIEEKKAMLATLDKDSEAYKNLKQSIEESESAVKDLTTSTVELQREAQKLATEEAISAMEKNFLGTDLEWAQTQWELINKQADMYLDDVNKAYNIQKLQNKYLNMLEKSNDLDIQQQITAQMDEQLDKLRKKTKLSEYDVQYANAQLDILQKKIALEEAQRNKSEMKLRRDSQGNYSYVYTANDADLSAAQDSLLDAENNAYNMSKEHMIQMNNEKYAALQDFFEKFRQIQNDMTISEEERTKRLQELQDANREILNAISEQLGVSQENMLKDFSDITELILEENAGNLNDINEAIVNGNKDAMDQLDERWTESLDKIGKFGDAFSEKNKEVIEGLNTTLQGYETSVNEVASSVSGGFNTITESIKESQEATSNLNTETNALIESLQKTTGEIGKTQEKINGYITEIKLGNEKIEGLENTVKRLQAELLEEQRKRLLAEQAAANGNSSAAAGGGGAGGGGSATSNNGNAEIGDAVTYNGGAFWYRSNPLGGDPHGTTSAGSMVYITNINPNGKYPYHISRGPHLGSGDLGWLSLSQLSGYDTGGYTGSWGENTFDNKNGKLAVLHQKELVLNATDTANILTAVSAVRDMAQIFKMNSLEGIASSISNSLNNYQTIPQLGQDVNQNVHITAEFPNVSSSAEIEQALLTLNDRAIQYAFKNR